MDERTQSSDVPNGLWPLQYQVNHKMLHVTLPSHSNPKLTKHTCAYYIAQYYTGSLSGQTD